MGGLTIACLILLGLSALNAGDDADATRTLEALRSLGVRFTVDDKVPEKPPIGARLVTSGEGADRTREFAPIRKLNSLKGIELHGFGVNDRLVDYLTELSNLESIDLVHTYVTDSGIQRLSNLRKLRRLRLCLNYDITDRGIRYLGRLTNLEELHISYSPKLTGAGLIGLRRLKKLRDLDLEWSNITDDGVRALCSASRDGKPVIDRMSHY